MPADRKTWRRPNGSLKAARVVARTEEQPGEKDLIKIYRDMRKADPVKFARELRDMEKDFSREKVMNHKEWSKINGLVDGEQVVVERDRCLVLAEQLIADLVAKK